MTFKTQSYKKLSEWSFSGFFLALVMLFSELSDEPGQMSPNAKFLVAKKRYFIGELSLRKSPRNLFILLF